VGALYYLTTFIVAARLLGTRPMNGVHAAALGMLVALLLGNALWNAAFFRRRDLGLSWKVARLYALLALGLAAVLWRADRVALWIFVPPPRAAAERVGRPASRAGLAHLLPAAVAEVN
jgi:tryptophan-rich sensory protein